MDNTILFPASKSFPPKNNSLSNLDQIGVITDSIRTSLVMLKSRIEHGNCDETYLENCRKQAENYRRQLESWNKDLTKTYISNF